MTVFNLPFQSSDMGIDVATTSDIESVKAIWGDRAPLGTGGFFAVAASLPVGVEESDKTAFMIQRRVNAIMKHAGVLGDLIAPIGIRYNQNTKPGLEITPQVVTDVMGNPLHLPANR